MPDPNRILYSNGRGTLNTANVHGRGNPSPARVPISQANARDEEAGLTHQHINREKWNSRKMCYYCDLYKLEDENHQDQGSNATH